MGVPDVGGCLRRPQREVGIATMRLRMRMALSHLCVGALLAVACGTVGSSKPKTPAEAAQRFMSALIKGDTNAALDLMSSSSRSSSNSRVSKFTDALRPCASSTAEYSNVQAAPGTVVVFTPPCGRWRDHALAAAEISSAPETVIGNSPIRRCQILTNVVNEEWRVMALPSCDP